MLQLVFASDIKKGKLQKTSATGGHCRKDLTTCNDTSTSCVPLSLEVGKEECDWHGSLFDRIGV